LCNILIYLSLYTFTFHYITSNGHGAEIVCTHSCIKLCWKINRECTIIVISVVTHLETISINIMTRTYHSLRFTIIETNEMRRIVYGRTNLRDIERKEGIHMCTFILRVSSIGRILLKRFCHPKRYHSKFLFVLSNCPINYKSFAYTKHIWKVLRFKRNNVLATLLNVNVALFIFSVSLFSYVI